LAFLKICEYCVKKDNKIVNLIISRAFRMDKCTKMRKKERASRKARSSLRIFVQSADYSAAIAPVGQAPSQAPQSMQAPASTTATPLSRETAPTGQAPSQAPQPTHASETLCAMIILLSTRANRNMEEVCSCTATAGLPE
jgi:hypothetical protein